MRENEAFTFRLGQAYPCGATRKVHRNEKGFLFTGARVGNNLFVFVVHRRVHAVGEYFVSFSKRDRLLIKLRNAARAGFRLDVDLFVIRVHHKPWCARGEASVFFRVPLHGCTGVVARHVHNYAAGDELWQVHHALQKREGVDGLIILPFALGDAAVGHAAFFTLINKRRAAKREVEQSKCLGAFAAEALIVAKARDLPRLVMVGKVVANPPSVFLHGALPRIYRLLKVFYAPAVKLAEVELSKLPATQKREVELEHHFKLFVFGLGVARHRGLPRHGALAHRKAVVRL